VVLVLSAAAVVACAAPEPAALQGVNECNRARGFTLATLDGSRVSLSDHRGDVVVVNFWATWCPPCRAEIPDLEAAYQAHRDKGFAVLGVNVEESRQEIRVFMASLDMSYPVLLDEEGRVLQMYRALGLPMSVIVDRDGVIQVRHVGYMTAAQLGTYLADLLP
jgi:thiol-disulfide isomerase/thioredoxin